MIKLLVSLVAIGYVAAQAPSTTCYQDDLKISQDAGGVGLFDWVTIDNTQHQENPYNLEPYDIYVSMTKGSLGTRCGTVRRSGQSQIHKIACRGTKGRWIHYVAPDTTEMIVLCKVGVQGRPVPKPTTTPKPTPPPTTPKPTAPAKLNPQCTEVGQADIVFVIDASGSVKLPNFNKEKEFVAEIIRQLHQIRPDGNGIRIAAMTFSHSRNFIWGPQLTSKMSNAQYRAGVTNLRYTKGGTDTAKALRLAEAHLASYGRRGIPNIIVTVTDGKSNNRVATIAQANKMKGKGNHMISVGIGANLYMKEMDAMADRPLSKFKFVVQDFNVLTTIASKVKKALFCKPQANSG